MNKKIFVLLIAILIVGGVVAFMTNSNEAQNEEAEGDFLTINEHRLHLEVMRTGEEKVRGLSGRKSLGANTGMLFVYEEPTIPSFWMKDMNFPIDIIWIGQDNKIADITENLAPETYPKLFQPKDSVQYVLEVNAGWAESQGVSEGDEVVFDFSG